MIRVLRYSAVALALAVAAPPSAAAQVYPERIREISKHAVEMAYQRRDRGDDRRAQAVEKFTKTAKIGADGILEVSNIAGNITVSRGSGTDATIEVSRTARGRDDADAKEQLSLVRVEVNERPGRAEVRERYPERGTNDRHSWSVTTDFTITAPGGTRLVVKSISGDLKVTDIKGEVSAETVSGNVTLSSIGRVTNAKTISGNVDIQDTQFDGSLEAGSVSGDVVMRRVSARSLSLGSVSGNVKLEDVQADRIDAHTTSGNASFAGQLARSGRYELKSFSGEVRLSLSGNTGFELDASSFSGDVRSDLPLTIRGASDEKRGRRRSMHGTYGDGSAVVNVTTFSGSVVISKR
jgi:hypothetical protein